MEISHHSTFSVFGNLAVALVVAAGMSRGSAHAAYTKIDDFESYTSGSNIGGQGNWHSVGTAAKSQVVADPSNGANKCLRVNAAWSGCYNTLASAIPANSTTTIFFRGNFPGQYAGDSMAGLSKNNPPSSMVSNDSDLTVGLKYNGWQTPYIEAYNNSSLVAVLNNTGGSWYKFWVVVNTAANTYAVWTNTAGPVAASGLAFRGDGTSTALPCFIVGGQGSNGSGNNYVDDIYIDYSGDNHTIDPTTPATPPVPTGLTISGCNSQAVLSWSPAPGAMGYLLKRSTSPGAESSLDSAASTIYTDTTVTVGNTYYYVVVATNAVGVSTNSAEVSTTISVNTLPTVTQQPADASVYAGSTASFTSTASDGSPVQWQVSLDSGDTWNNIGGATSTTYSFTTASTDNGKQYRAQFSSLCGSVNSGTALLTLNTVVVGPGDPRDPPMLSMAVSTNLSVSAYGAIPDDGLDDSLAISSALQAAQNLAQTSGQPVELDFQRGTYDLFTPVNAGSAMSMLTLSQANNLVINGNGATILIHQPQYGFLYVLRCSTLIMENFTIDYDPLPFTQGTVTAVNPVGNTFTVNLAPGFPSLTNSYFANAGQRWGLVKDPNHPLRHKTGTKNVYNINSWTTITSSQFVITPAVFPTGLAVGDAYVQLARTNSAAVFRAGASSNVTYLANTIHASPAVSYVAINTRLMNYIGCKTIPTPGRWQTTCADGILCQQYTIGPWIEGCEIVSPGDDEISLLKRDTSFVIRNNILRDSRRWGIATFNSNGVIEGNYIESACDDGIRAAGSNILICSNIVADSYVCNDSGILGGTNDGVVNIPIQDGGSSSPGNPINSTNFTILCNTLTQWNSVPGLSLGNGNSVQIGNNCFSAPVFMPSNQTPIAINVYSSEGVQIMTNNFGPPWINLAQALQVQATTSNIVTTANLVTTVTNAGISQTDFPHLIQWLAWYYPDAESYLDAMTSDTDGDGQSAQAEFLAGTDPTNSASVFRILSVIAQGNDINVTWQTVGGKTNVVQATAGSYSTNFMDVSGPLVVTGSSDMINNYVDVGGATNGFSRFYRVRLVR